MPSLFAGLAVAAGATVDAVFSEGFHLEPLAPPPAAPGRVRDVNARLVASTARAALAFIGTWVEPGELMNAHGRTKADSTTHWVAGAKAMIDAPADGLAQRPQTGDRVHRDDTGAAYEVAKVLDGDFGRLRIFVTDAAQRAEAPR